MKCDRQCCLVQSEEYSTPVFTPASIAMAMNRIQFQPGLSTPGFFAQFGSEAQCEPALATASWSVVCGFSLPLLSGLCRGMITATSCSPR